MSTSISISTAVARAAGVVALAAAALVGSVGSAGTATARSTQGSAAVAVSALPSAMTIAQRMDRDPYVSMSDPRDEGPATVVKGGLCTRLAEAGCRKMVATKDASIMVFSNRPFARLYVGNADDRAAAVGRMVVSFGSPPRVRPARQPAYVRAVKVFREKFPDLRGNAEEAVAYLTAKGLLMRDPHFEDRRGERLGLASKIPGAVDMVATDNADVIVFADRASAEEYMGNADDVAYRRGRVVLSYGAPPRVVPNSRPDYERAFRKALA